MRLHEFLIQGLFLTAQLKELVDCSELAANTSGPPLKLAPAQALTSMTQAQTGLLPPSYCEHDTVLLLMFMVFDLN